MYSHSELKTIGCFVAGLLVVLATIAAILLPDLWDAYLKNRQNATYADMISIGSALNSYRLDNGFYPAAGGVEELIPTLQPTYIKVLPTKDMWQAEFRYQSWRENPDAPGPDAYAIGSSGKDYVWEHPDLREYPEIVTKRFKNDIVFRSGRFVQFMDVSDDSE